MPKLTLAGHPLHPQLVAAPLGLLPFSSVMDAMYAATGEQCYADAAYYTMVGGAVGAVAAGAAGAADYLTIPSNTRLKKAANTHAILNLGVLGLYGVNLLIRSADRSRVGAFPMILSAVSAVGLAVSQWYGGYMVYEEGMRVRPLEREDSGPELKLPGDDRLVEQLERLEELAPQGGPTL